MHRRFIAMLVVDVLVVIAVLSVNSINNLLEATTAISDSVVNEGEQAHDPHVGLVSMRTTGFEDLRESELRLSELKVVKALGDLPDVTLVLQ
jgi:hypothetical protein